MNTTNYPYKVIFKTMLYGIEKLYLAMFMINNTFK